MHRTILRILPGLAVPSTVAAQLPPIELSQSISSQETLAHKGAGLQYRSSAVGDLDDNLDPEVVYLLDDDVIVFMNVTTSTASFVLDHAANDLAIVERAGKDHLVLADALGIDVIEFDFDYQAQTIAMSETRFGGLPCGGVSVLHLGQLDGLEGPDLLGLGTDGQELVALLDAPGQPGGWIIDGLLSASADYASWELCTANLTGTEIGIAVLGLTGVQLLDRQGGTIDGFPGAGARGTLARYRLGTKDRLAWTRPGPSGDELVVISDGGASVAEPLGSWVVGSSTALVDGDHDLDLVLSVDSASEIHMLENVLGSFSGSTVRVLDTGNLASTGNTAQPVAWDLDDDGTTDLALADFSTKTLEVFLNDDGLDHALLVPEVYYLDLAEQAGVVEWEFYAGNHASVAPPSANRLGVRVYNQHPGSAGWSNPHSDPLPFATQLVRIGGSVESVTFPLAGPNVQEGDFVTYVEARYVTVGAQNEVIAKFPPIWFSLVDPDNQPAIAYLRDHFPGQTFTENQIGDGETVGGGSGPPPSQPPGPGGG